MHVTRVELENIKCYEHAEFSFSPGTTAIVGQNGAGKTTILEAIAWTLFDTLDYKKEDFLRRGAQTGLVRVTFESDLDERQYTVYRNTGNRYYVYDHGLGVRLAEGGTDVRAFLRQHLGIEPGTDLKALFRSAIGVPQGSFTTEFMLAPNARKAAFDRLLKVEEYRESSDRLRDTINLIRDRATDIRERIAGSEGRLAGYDGLVEQHEAIAERRRVLEQTLQILHNEIEEHALTVDRFEEAERQAVERRAQAERLAVERSASVRRLADLRLDLDASLHAQQRQQATAAAYGKHLSALDQLQHLETERTKRDRLRGEAERTARLVMTAENDVRRSEDALYTAEQARISLEELRNQVSEQESAERERERLRDLRARSIAAHERLTRLDTELAALRQQHTQTRERVRTAEAARDAQPHVDRLESDRIFIDNELSRVREAITNRTHLTNQRRDAAREAERLRQTIASLMKEIGQYQSLAAGAARISELEASERQQAEQAAHLRAEIKHDERMRTEVKGGLCPILSQRCLNIGQDQTLDGYFTDQLAINRTQLAAAESASAQAAAALHRAREAQVAAARLDTAQLRLEHERQLLLAREEAVQRIDQDLATIVDAGANRLRELQIQLVGIDGELKTARDLVVRYAELETQRKRLAEIEQEGKRKKEERSELVAAANAVASLDDEIAATEQRLRLLNDPRGQAVSMRAEAARADIIKAELEKGRTALHALYDQSHSLAAQLERFSELDEQWAAVARWREQTAEAYREYLACAQWAAMLSAREAAFNKAAEEAERVRHAAEEAQHASAIASAAYDREQHTAVRLALSLRREQVAATSAQFEAAAERAVLLQAEITRLDEVRQSLRAEFQAKEELENLHETTDFVRDILKQAGPLVTESYLYNISIEANGLFREITGEAGRALRWSRDYEIILEEGGYERTFMNFSGGEQMVAALSIRLALLKQLSDIRIAFFDEPTVNMDAERRQNLARQLGQVRHFDQLFVISHDDTFEETVDQVVLVGREVEEAA